jgi:hypothetical protein
MTIPSDSQQTDFMACSDVLVYPYLELVICKITPEEIEEMRT